MAIISNKAQCGNCGDIIESKHNHDFVRCGCGETFVDGGTYYLRRGFGAAGYKNLSEYDETDEDKPGLPEADDKAEEEWWKSVQY